MAKITFQGTTINTNGDIPPLNTQAPEFCLIDSELRTHSLADFQGKKLLNVVPSIDTPVCAQSTKYFNLHVQNKPNCFVLTISSDLPFAQKRFCEAENIKTVTILSLMNNPQFAKDYGLLLIDGPLKGLTARAVFVLDDKNTVIYRELVSEITQEPDYQSALKYL